MNISLLWWPFLFTDYCHVNTLRPRRIGHHFADDIFKRLFFNENAWISIKISLKFVPTGRINNFLALVQIMAWRRPGDKPLSEPMVVSLPTHICVTRPQRVNWTPLNGFCHHFLWLSTVSWSHTAWMVLCIPVNKYHISLSRKCLHLSLLIIQPSDYIDFIISTNFLIRKLWLIFRN